ncbi:MAG: winged helix DNA-binding protein [Chloroflexi bacterium]|nr:winged helix DNA-binding protein [Chloroflexota bacterium]
MPTKIKKTIEPTKVSEDDWRLWVLLNQASDAIARVRDLELSKIGVSLMQMAVLEVMKSIGTPATTAQISRWLLREHHTIGALLDRMEKHDMVRCELDMNRRRRKLYIITEKGEEAYQLSRPSDVIISVLSDFNEKEKAVLRNQLKELRDKAVREFAGFRLQRQSIFP